MAQAQKDQGPVEPPPPEEWVIEPPYISPLDIDIIKLSAQFIARNGKPFQFGLFNREAKNPQFGFLQENHPLHSYFRQLVESYSRVILPPKDIIENLEKMIHSKTMILDRIMKKVRWEKAQIKTEEQKKAEEEKERVLMASIDWHDFVVVETIDFDDDEKLPAPLADPTKLTKTSTGTFLSNSSVSSSFCIFFFIFHFSFVIIIFHQHHFVCENEKEQKKQRQ